MAAARSIAPPVLTDWAAAVLRGCGVPAAHAHDTARLLVRSDLRGWTTHGMTRLASYVERILAGDVNANPSMAHRAFAGGVVLQADGALGQVAGLRAIGLARQGLQASASVLVSLRDCGHLGALGVLALAAAEDGLLCVLGQRTPPLMAMEGFARPAIGHNPIAFACPVPGGDPIVFDMACSVAARGHILLAARGKEAIPAGWALDARGRGTTDADAALAGSLLPAGSHKGMGIAMMVECLAGALGAHADAAAADAAAVPRSGAVGGQSAFLWLVRPEAFADGAAFGAHMSHWIARYLAAGGEQARLPGRRGAQSERDARVSGVCLPAAIVTELRALGECRGIAFPFDA